MHPQDLSAYLGADIYRIEAVVDEGEGWNIGVPNALAWAKAGESTRVKVVVGKGVGASDKVKVRVTVTSESDATVRESKTCKVRL